MNVKIQTATEDPAREVATAARNDYLEKWVGREEYADVIEPIDGETTDEKTRNFIEHLLRDQHYGPFEHVSITFQVEGISRSLMAQITRHRHATFDIQSMRYVDFEIEEGDNLSDHVVEIPELEDPGICGRNAEFSEKFKDMGDWEITNKRARKYWESVQESFRTYEELLDLGVAPENARMVLPIGTKVNMVFTINARQLMHIGDMRAKANAQWEIRNMTEAILEFAKEWFPECFEYYDEEMKGRKNSLAP